MSISEFKEMTCSTTQVIQIMEEYERDSDLLEDTTIIKETNSITKYLCCQKLKVKKFSLIPLLFLTSFVISLEFFAKNDITENISKSDDVTKSYDVTNQPADEEYTEKSTNLPFIHTSIIRSNESRSIHKREKFEDGNNDVYFTLDELEKMEMKRQKRDADFPFGKRPFGPLSKYWYPTYRGHTWVAYFLEESLVTVLQNKDRVMVDCTVIELREEDEQKEALRTFGNFMELVPVSLSEMVRLIKLCGDLPRNQIEIQDGDISESEASRQSAIIIPGTLWCGIRDRAPRYENLGRIKKLDNCCRTHDHCPLKVGAFENRYGLINFGLASKSHCLCDNEFYNCLKNDGSEMANMVSNLFFEFFRVECLQPLNENGPLDWLSAPANTLYNCDFFDENKKCRHWRKRIVSYDLKFERFNGKEL